MLTKAYCLINCTYCNHLHCLMILLPVYPPPFLQVSKETRVTVTTTEATAYLVLPMSIRLRQVLQLHSLQPSRQIPSLAPFDRW